MEGPKAQENKPRKTKRGGTPFTVIGIVAVIAALIAGAAGWYYYYGPCGTSRDKPANETGDLATRWLAADTAPCLRILFIGNSYTFVNDLPNTFAELARAGGHKVQTGMAAKGGWTLADHVNSSETLDKLTSSHWDFVVLQEQSQIPAIEQSRNEEMYPAARLLVRKSEETGAIPMFFLTWAHRNGWPENGIQGYEGMQYQIDSGYLRIAQELNVPVAPVGYAWLLMRIQYPQLDLWQEDGIHPNEQGTYLAACVFYAAIFHQSPEGLNYLARLPKETAQELQKIAADTVLSNPGQWHLPNGH